ncbi:MAG TPA: DEAD/DEAH box helicase, partial [Actinomycetota bacterium]|nr:DEAD/DEAH box helicase [Actinomycetota bacterium]
RKEAEPVTAGALARFLPAWHGVGPAGPRSADADAVYRVISRLQGAPIPASALERQILPARLPGYSAAVLDQLCASGEVVWAGVGAIGPDDGWVALGLADRAPLLLPDPPPVELSETAAAVREALSDRGALFFRQVVDATGSEEDTEVLLALWELVWAGLVTNDTLAALRALTDRGGLTRRTPRRRRGPVFPPRSGPPAAAGRWSLLPPREPDPTRRKHAIAAQLLERHGVVTRGAVASERIPGGFAAVYPVLKAMEEAGSCRRGYFVEGLGGAQFAPPGAVDRLRVLAEPPPAVQTLVLAATDPANPYGAALPWPAKERERPAHRPGRKAGAVVVLVDGELAVYVERGGRTLLTHVEDPEVLRPAVDALALAVRDGMLGKLTVERADGAGVFDTPLARALTEAGFVPSTRGLRLRG